LSPCFSYVKSEKAFYKSIIFVHLLRQGPPDVKWEIILKWIFKKWDGDEWTGLLWLRDRWRALVDAVMNLRIKKKWEFLDWLSTG